MRSAGSLFILRLFGSLRMIRVTAYILVVVSILQGLATLIVGFSICRPLARAWDQSISGRCGNEIAAFLASEILGLFVDLVIVTAPLVPLRSLQVSLSIKLGIGVLLSAGSL